MALHKLEYQGTRPERQRGSDAGYDLRANIEAPVWIPPGKRRTIPLGTKIAVPHGYAGDVIPRSGLAANHGITILNAPGLIDPGYRGEVMAVVFNTDDEPFRVDPGMRIAQLRIVKVEHPKMVEVPDLGWSDRGVNGLGSSGTE